MGEDEKRLFFFLLIALSIRGIQQQSTCDISMFEDVEEDLLEFSPYPPNTTINDRLNKKCSCEVGSQVDMIDLLECF